MLNIQKIKSQPWLRNNLGGLLPGLIDLGLATLILKIFNFEQYLYNVALVFILIVLLIASQYGLWSGIVVSVIGFLSLDYFFIPPYYTLVIDSRAGVVALGGFLLAAILTSQIAAQARSKAYEAQVSQQETAILNELNQAVLSEAQAEAMLERVVEQVARHLSALETVLYLPQAEGLAVAASQPSSATGLDLKIARQVFAGGQPHYLVLPTGEAAYLPLQRSGDGLGVMAVLLPLDESARSKSKKSVRLPSSGLERWLNIIANQVALTVEHARLVQVNAQVESLREADQLKSALLASVSHELRTPLTSIKNVVAGLRDEEIRLEPSEQAEYLEVLDQETDRLSRLISNLLNLSRLETGTLKTQKGLYFLPEIIAKTIERLQRGHFLQNHPVSTRYEPNLPLVPVDYLQMEQVVTNLVENAAKYSRPGLPIAVRVTQSPRPDRAARSQTPPRQPLHRPPPGVLIEVLDEGIGIPENELERVFDKFYRLEYRSQKGGSWQVGGTGLGLAISKGIIENHDGLIWASQRAYGGTTFAVWLPLDESNRAEAQSDQPLVMAEVGDQPVISNIPAKNSIS